MRVRITMNDNSQEVIVLDVMQNVIDGILNYLTNTGQSGQLKNWEVL